MIGLGSKLAGLFLTCSSFHQNTNNRYKLLAGLILLSYTSFLKGQHICNSKFCFQYGQNSLNEFKVTLWQKHLPFP